MKQIYLVPTLFIVLLALPARSQPLNALHFVPNGNMAVTDLPPMFINPGANDFTIEAWLNFGFGGRVFSAYKDNGNYASILISHTQQLYFYVGFGGNSIKSVATSSSLPLNQWVHIAISWDHKTQKASIYFNGVKQSASFNGGATAGSHNKMIIGGNSITDYSGVNYGGYMDDFRVWNIALRECDIMRNYKKTMTGPQPGLVANYNFDEGVAGADNSAITVLPDKSGNGYNATLMEFLMTGTTSNFVTSAAGITSTGNADLYFPNLYVNAGAAPGGIGNSWGSAFTTISEALNKASQCNAPVRIHIAKGTYWPTAVQAGADRSVFYGIRAGIRLYGGYDAVTGERNPAMHETILSGDIGQASVRSDNSLNVMIIAGLTANDDSVIVDGFSFKDGNADIDSHQSFNGQTYNTSRGAALVITGNNDNPRIAIRNCTFIDNKALNQGGALYIDANSNPTLTNCLLIRNIAYMGGGIFVSGPSLLKMHNCTVADNIATVNPAALYSNVAAEIINTIITGNRKAAGGLSGIQLGNQPSNIRNCLIQNMLPNSSLGILDFNLDPLFTNAAGGDYTLLPASPVINKGDSNLFKAATDQLTDLANKPRIKKSNIDLGAYEFQPLIPVITPVAGINKVYGDAAFDPSVTSSAPLPLTLQSADNTIAVTWQDIDDGNKWKIKVLKAGTVAITASQEGDDAIYDAAQPMSFDLTVAPKPITVIAAPQAKLYGSADPALTYSLGNTSLVGGDQFTGSLSRVAGNNAGDYAILQNNLDAGANYQISYTGDFLRIGKAPLQVSALAASKVYGTTDPAFTYTATGFQYTDDIGVLTGTLTRTSGENAGNYDIYPIGLDAGNYSIFYTPGVFTITKAPQTISWTQDLTLGCNGANALLLNGQSSSGLPLKYTIDNTAVFGLSGNTLTPVSAGSTVIRANQPGDANHEPATELALPATYQLPGIIRQQWNDVIVFDNTGSNYVQWQWYKNGNAIAGATKPWYNEAAALNGNYYVMATGKNGQTIQSCPLTLTGSATVVKGIKVLPNPAKPGITATVTCNFTDTELIGAKLIITGMAGNIVQQISTVQQNTPVTMPATAGLYSFTMLLGNGQKSSVNVLIK